MSAIIAVLDEETGRFVLAALALGRRELRRNGTALPAEFDTLVDALAARTGPDRTPLPSATELPEPALMSYQETGRRLGVSERTVRRLVAAGELHAVRVGRRVLLRLADVEGFGLVRRAG